MVLEIYTLFQGPFWRRSMLSSGPGSYKHHPKLGKAIRSKLEAQGHFDPLETYQNMQDDDGFFLHKDAQG